jgi:hypothetical protein
LASGDLFQHNGLPVVIIVSTTLADLEAAGGQGLTWGQRIVLYAKDRGCTAPGCTVPGYYSDVHHVIGYAACRCTDLNNLTFGCGTNTASCNPESGAPAKTPAATPSGYPRRI